MSQAAPLLVEREQVRRECGSKRVALGALSLAFCIDAGESFRCPPLGISQVQFKLRLVLGKNAHRSSSALSSLHHLQLDVLQLPLAASQGLKFVLQVLQLLRVVDGSRIQEFLVFPRPLAHLIHIGVGSCLLSGEVGDDRLGRNEFSTHALQPITQFRCLARLRQMGPFVLELAEMAVMLCKIEKLQLHCRIGVHRTHSPFHGSVDVLETIVRTVSPTAARSDSSAAAAMGSHGHSLAQCETSINAQPPATR